MTEKLEKGVLDFAVVVEEPDRKKYHALRFPDSDLWGLVMPSSCDLAQKRAVTFEDLRGLPLFCSAQDGWLICPDGAETDWKS